MTDMSTIPSARRFRRKKGKCGRLNKLAEPLAPVDGTEWPPAMKALASDRHRAYVLALYEVPLGHGAHVRAAKRAGFGTSTSSASSWSSIACRLQHDEKIQAAILEMDRLRIRSAAPRAIRALEHLIEQPDHQHHIRAVTAVLDRTHAVQQHHVVDVHHHVDHDAEAIAQLRMLKALEVSRAKLEEVFGFSGLSRYERLLELEDARKAPRMIEGSAA